MIKIFLFHIVTIVFLFSFSFAEEVKIIELHGQSIDQLLKDSDNGNLAKQEEANIEINQIDLEEDSTEENSEDTNKENENNNEINDIVENNSEEIDIDQVTEDDLILSSPDIWKKTNKDEFIFLAENIKLINSKVLNNLLINSFSISSYPPLNLNEEEFKILRIENLIKLGQREKAFDIINASSEFQDKYNIIKLNHFFSKYELSQACDFSESIDRKNDEFKNYILKVDIFCSFIKNKIEEADFLNSLLEDSNDQDKFFQNIFMNLKNGSKNLNDINQFNYNSNLMSLYSAMLRVGDMPLSNNFLEYDSFNLSMPIVLSGSSDISLRLRAAHEAYSQDIFSAESLSALYQTVDFTYEELINSDSTIKKLKKRKELIMSYLFQKANIQILPITRLETLVEFWKFAEIHDLNILAYDISRNLIDNIEPSAELAEYGIYVAQAHIYNSNYESADKWILFSENYVTENKELKKKINFIKLLYNLKKSENLDEFENILLESDLIVNNSENNIKEEILLTIQSVIDENYYINQGNSIRKLVDMRPMPSRYLINKINNNSLNNNFGELALSISTSMIDKTWEQIHPEHLKIILIAFRNNNIDNIFKNLILEILEDSNII